jgi:hypothetical protein
MVKLNYLTILDWFIVFIHGLNVCMKCLRIVRGKIMQRLLDRSDCLLCPCFPFMGAPSYR